MLLIIGLGNPGKEYARTRHNAGFLLVDYLKEKYAFPDFEFNKKLNCETSKKAAANGEVMLIKPQTFMNESGRAIRAVLDFYKIKPENMVVLHDEIDLPLGTYKITNNSSSAGHNGVQDIIDHIGTQNFRRIRVGIANEDLRAKIEPGDFVLQKFTDEELSEISALFPEITGGIFTKETI
jgi:PTH1 family peptidyl-tRNA hydrolase